MQSIIKLVIGILPIAIAIIFLIVRIHGSKKPLSQRRIFLPPIGMSGGFVLFLYTPMQIPWQWGLVAFLFGALIFSLPLILTTRYLHRNGQVFIQRSSKFILLLLTLLIVRIALHHYVKQFITIEQTVALFYVFAFGMILAWRITMFIYYRTNQVVPLHMYVKKDRTNV